MKKIFENLAMLLLAVLTLSACSPEEFTGADQNGLPTVDGVDFTLDVDQTVNQITAKAPSMPGCYPLWIINGAKYSTLSDVQWSNKKAGTYDIELHIANRNGVSQASIKKQFTFEKTLVDFSPYYDRFNGKVWRIDYDETGHLGCGPSGTTGVDWWKAQPNDKKDWGVYDDRLTFTVANKGDDGGTYTYNPGEGGTMFVNTGTTSVYPTFNTNDGEDFMATVAEQTTTFTLESGTWTDSEGKQQDCVYLVFPANTCFPYVSADTQWSNPRFRIEKSTSERMDLVYDAGSIAWHFTLTSKPEGAPQEDVFQGYKYDSEFNLWKNATFTNEFYYVNTGSWTPNPNPIGFEDKGNGNYVVTLPDPSEQQWQAQVKFLTNMSASAALKYDFSAKFTASQEVKGATIKLTMHGDDNTFFFMERVDLPAGEPVVFYKDGFDGIDMANVDLVLDFGGAPAGTEIEISNVVLKDHAADDGAGHPKPVVDKTPYTYDTADNEWKAVDAGTPEMFFYYADANWAPYANPPGYAHDGNKYTITMPLATAAQWQAQVAFYTNLSCKAADVYDFGCIMTPNVDLKGVTVKLVKYGGGDNDNIFFFLKNVDLVGGEDNVIKLPAQVSPADMDRISLFLDFGGNPENTEVVIKDIVLKKTAK